MGMEDYKYRSQFLRNPSEVFLLLSFRMNILTLFIFCLLAITSPVIARGRRCHSSTQCDYESVCYEGYCYTIDEMFDKYTKALESLKSAVTSQVRNGGTGGGSRQAVKRSGFEAKRKSRPNARGEKPWLKKKAESEH
ncbi:hypothetical protein GCK72_009128 [Caenorhabditis remanei]|uniref:Uncharacterized protein n=1 Tax=Caenorhabditis remanei TaxID=31234 RepID=A0A6A5H0T3_CAERE|nr:hypothetical protein GCK72_009128 [Caenorhabditis remanei]KAF1760877.1 hypothetical protein GCK72_009128 [Caenorhabditis remanei]